MAEYIEREAVLSLAKDICVLTKWDTEYHHRSIDPIDVRELPAADVVPVRHGRWIWYDSFSYRCSACKKYWISPGDQYDYHYCPHCGARMDEPPKEET